MMQIDGNGILIISVFSPIGNAALGLGKNEFFEVETPKEIREYKVIDVY
jgi:transcription elongation GreA/GreB family factor